MKKLKYIFLTVLVLSPLFYFFVGNEIIGREEGYEYSFFIKKHPTTLFTFRNWVLCGECDFKEYSILDTESQTDFRNLCYYRYNLTDIKQCENLFRY